MLKDITIGQYLYRDSFVHRLDPRTKILASLLFMVGIFFVAAAAARERAPPTRPKAPPHTPSFSISLRVTFIVVLSRKAFCKTVCFQL